MGIHWLVCADESLHKLIDEAVHQHEVNNKVRKKVHSDTPRSEINNEVGGGNPPTERPLASATSSGAAHRHLDHHLKSDTPEPHRNISHGQTLPVPGVPLSS